MLDRTALARDEAINEALSAAICDANADGIPRADAFAHHLGERGLVIVEARRLERLTVAIQLIGSAAAVACRGVVRDEHARAVDD